MTVTDFSPNHVLGFAFCPPPPALLMLVVSPEHFSCLLELLGNRCRLAGLVLWVSMSFTYLVTPFSCSLVTSHPCPQHCWTKVPPLPPGKSCWVGIESLWEGEPGPGPSTLLSWQKESFPLQTPL